MPSNSVEVQLSVAVQFTSRDDYVLPILRALGHVLTTVTW